MYTFKFVLLLLLPFLGEAKTSKSKTVCGGSLSGPSGSITTPHYPHNYPNNADCIWAIHGPARTKQIDFEFKYFDIEFGAKCEWDYVLIKDKDGNTVGSKLCGRKDSLKVSVPGDLAVIEFKSDAEISEKGFDVKYIIITPTPEPTTGSCNFDQGICPRISNVDNKVDNFDWTVHSGPTPTGYQLTGPKADHTTGKGKYVYIESTGRSKGDKAQLETQVMSGTRCLKFFYHMFGIIGMGSLKVYIVTNNARRLVISLSGDQGDEWKEERVQIRENVPYKVVFEGIVGASDYSDIAIDDITFSDEECKNWKECGGVLTAPSGLFTSPQYPSNYKDNLRCKWTIRPSKDTSIIIVRFAAFQVEMAPNCRDDYVTISDSNGHSVKKPRFCGFYGNGFGVKVHGKEAEVYFHSNNHLTDKGFNASYETIESTSPADCDFDQGVCQGWTNDFNDDIDWSIGNGFTRSFFTGPHNDIYILGNYAYIEASGRQPGDRAVLLSPSISGPQCLTFHYNMNGQKMGSLSISTHNGMGRKQVWKATGDHGKFWVKESISLDDVQPYKVSFEGIVGNGFTSDIAIDEVSFTSGRCPPKSGCNKILTGSHGSIQSPNYPSNYPSGVDCTWTIIPPPQYSNIAVSFHHIDMQDSLQCSNDYVAVEDIRGTPKGKKLCGKSKTTKTFEVDWHEANVHFHSDSSIVGKGFQASYQAFGYQPVCGGQLSGNGTFESPNYPDNYPNRVTCDWEITAPPGTKEIIIEFEDFAIDDSPITCSYDYVLVYDAQHGREVGKVCGMVKPWPVKVPGNIANVRFQSSHVHVGRGFKARYIAVSQ